MEQNEPSTGEIAFELRNMNPKHLITKGDGVTVEDVAADRLKSQDAPSLTRTQRSRI